MNEINIRQASEKAWRIISDREHISLSELAKNLNINMEIAALSAGWLQRTNFISAKSEQPSNWRRKTAIPFISDKVVITMLDIKNLMTRTSRRFDEYATK